MNIKYMREYFSGRKSASQAECRGFESRFPLVILLLLSSLLYSLEPIYDFSVIDMPYDEGKMIALGWRHKLDTPEVKLEDMKVKGYIVFRSEDGKSFKPIATIPYGMADPSTSELWLANGIKAPSFGRIIYQDGVDEDDVTYYYKIKAFAPSESTWVEISPWAATDTTYYPLPFHKNVFTKTEEKVDTILYRQKAEEGAKDEDKTAEERVIAYNDTLWVEAPAIEKEDTSFKAMPGMPGYFYKINKEEIKNLYKKDGNKAYKLKVIETYSPYSEIKSVKAKPQNWDWSKLNTFILSILFSVVLLLYIRHAKKGKELFIRRIAGLQEVDEAIGRATEMGRPILYISGLDGIGSISTIAAINILGEIAKRTAEYETPLIVPAYDVIVLQVQKEVLKEAYLHAGRPDAFNSEVKAFFLTDSQFGYAAAVDGIMLREKPAANFYMGMFYAESLIMTETGSASGAIQIAGTDAVTQIPFFITSCDYTLMGEELYAASGYLSREPRLLGSLKAVDFIKAVFMISITLGAFTNTLGWHGLANLFNTVICIFPN